MEVGIRRASGEGQQVKGPDEVRNGIPSVEDDRMTAQSQPYDEAYELDEDHDQASSSDPAIVDSNEHNPSLRILEQGKLSKEENTAAPSPADYEDEVYEMDEEANGLHRPTALSDRDGLDSSYPSHHGQMTGASKEGKPEATPPVVAENDGIYDVGEESSNEGPSVIIDPVPPDPRGPPTTEDNYSEDASFCSETGQSKDFGEIKGINTEDSNNGLHAGSNNLSMHPNLEANYRENAPSGSDGAKKDSSVLRYSNPAEEEGQALYEWADE